LIVTGVQTCALPISSSSAAICANVVSSPCPCGDDPVITVTLPDGSIFTVALSHPPAGVAGDGPIAQISPYVEIPMPISLPCFREIGRASGREGGPAR